MYEETTILRATREKATHCSKCAKEVPNLVDVVSKLCEENGCRKNVTRGYPGDKPIRCRLHALDGMIDVKSRKCVVCKEAGVNKQPTYGVTKPTHCKEHKTEEMTDLKHSRVERCIECSTRCTYGITGEKATHCSKHKSHDMVDVVSQMCSKCNAIQGVFGNGDTKKLFCKACSDGNMKNVRARMCEKCGEHQSCFNYKGDAVPRFCTGCKLKNMIDVRNPRCRSCHLFYVTRKKLCSYCSPHSTIKQKTREMLVVNRLTEEKILYEHDNSIGFVCGNYRPDVKIDADTHFVIVEIDEDQHRQYDTSCEIARMLNIHQAIGMRCVFIRYNPDVFRVHDKVTKVPTKIRLRTLVDQVKYHMSTLPDEEISVYRMYYNNDSVKHVEKYDIGYEMSKMIKTL